MSMITKQVKRLREYSAQRSGEIAQITREAADTIEMLSEKLRGGWIPVSERLPEDDGWYLCTVKNEIETKVAQIRFFEGKGWKIYGHEVIAWMNEPEPYVPGNNVGKMDDD